MIRIGSSIILCFLCAITNAQNQEEPGSNASTHRKALLQGLVDQDRGEITAIEPSTKNDGGVIIGYSSGVLLRCDSSHNCTEFIGTPSVSVEQIAVSRQGGSEIIWVTYRQGALYQCVATSCNKLR